MNKIFILVAVVIVAVAGWFGYQKFAAAPEAAAPMHYPGKVSIGYVPWPGYIGLYIAENKGYFKEFGVDVGLNRFVSLAEQHKSYIAGKDHAEASVTLDDLDEAYAGLDHKIVLAIDHSNGSDGIVASKNIKSMKDVRGKKVGYEFGTLEEFFLRYALEQYDMTLEDIQGFNLGPDKAVEALARGEVDVAVSYEPFLSSAQKEGIHKIYSSAEAPYLITDTLQFHTDFVQKYPDTVYAIIQAYFKGVQFWKDNPAEANAIIAKYLEISVPEVETQLSGVKVLNELENLRAFTFSTGLESLYGNLRHINEFIYEQQAKAGKEKIDSDKLIEPYFIKKLLK